jgi:hypothetical protein
MTGLEMAVLILSIALVLLQIVHELIAIKTRALESRAIDRVEVGPWSGTFFLPGAIRPTRPTKPAPSICNKPITMLL